jgi:hypothetical protein
MMDGRFTRTLAAYSKICERGYMRRRSTVGEVPINSNLSRAHIA